LHGLRVIKYGYFTSWHHLLAGIFHLGGGSLKRPIPSNGSRFFGRVNGGD
jgi:hypothetical protein